MLAISTKKTINLNHMSLIEDFISLIFPNICACCGNSLWKHEEIICTFCDFHLPRTNYHLELENPVSKFFWGRARIESATAYCYFNKGNKVQRLVHLLKYKGRKDIGIYIGEKQGHLLKDSPFFSTVEVILPVPSHKKKRIQRGYNQSEQFAIGLGKAMQVPVNPYVLSRTRYTETQTRKSRFKRWENVSGMFALEEPVLLEGKHILLVDDVITTGATLESCVSVLSAIPGIRISIAAIAVTMH
jgi:ComF family protein